MFWAKCIEVLGLEPEIRAGACPGDYIWGDGFEIETLINMRIAAAGLAGSEVASYEHARIHGVSNLDAFTDECGSCAPSCRSDAVLSGARAIPATTFMMLRAEILRRI